MYKELEDQEGHCRVSTETFNSTVSNDESGLMGPVMRVLGAQTN